jgi:hypothetical protein
VATKKSSIILGIVSDVHFWIPVIVLAGGLAVLHWIS